MSTPARQNGWRGFDGIGEKAEGGWLYRCDGMPSMFGCGEQKTVTRRLARVGTKASGWLVTYGEDENGEDRDVVLTFCPSCAAVVKEQDALRKQVRDE